MKSNARPAGLGASAVLVLALCGSTQAAEWQVTPGSRLTPVYTTNPRLLAEGGDDVFGNVSELSAFIRKVGDRLAMSLSPRATFSQYQGDELLGSNDQFLGMQSSWQSERATWSADAQLAHDSTQISELGTTGLVQANRRRELTMLSAGPRWEVTETIDAGSTVQWTSTHYAKAADTGLVDYAYSMARMYGIASLSERAKVSLSAQGGKLDVPSRDNATYDANVMLSLNQQLNPQWTTELSAGPSWADSGVAQDQGYLFAADIVRRGETIELQAGLSRKLNPTGRGLLTQADALTLSASHALSEKVSIGVSGLLVENRDIFSELGIPEQQLRYYDLTGWCNWRLSGAWTASLTLGGRSQEITYSAINSGASADSYRVSLGLAWNGRTLTR